MHPPEPNYTMPIQAAAGQIGHAVLLGAQIIASAIILSGGGQGPGSKEAVAIIERHLKNHP